MKKPICPCCGGKDVIMILNGGGRYLECERCGVSTKINPPKKVLKRWRWKE